MLADQAWTRRKGRRTGRRLGPGDNDVTRSTVASAGTHSDATNEGHQERLPLPSLAETVASTLEEGRLPYQ